jgi:hypothetical protein
MISLKFTKFSEKFPEIGRHVILWSDEYGSFDKTYIGQKHGKTSYEYYDSDEGMVKLFAIGESFVGEGEEIGLDTYWVYEDDIFPIMFDEYFYSDWLWYVKHKMAKLKVIKVDRYISHRNEKSIFIEYEFKYRNETWIIHCNYRYIFKLETK